MFLLSFFTVFKQEESNFLITILLCAFLFYICLFLQSCSNTNTKLSKQNGGVERIPSTAFKVSGDT